MEEKGLQKKTKRSILLAGLGAILMFIGIISFSLKDAIYNKIIYEATLLSPYNVFTFPEWTSPTVNIYFKLYIFNCTNSEDVVKKHAKPHMVELGPYVFREYRNKKNIKWHDNDTVSYYEEKKWIFLPEASKGTLEDKIVNLNAPAIVAADRVSSQHFIMHSLTSIVLQILGETLFHSYTVKDVFFDGFESPILDLAKILHLADDNPYDEFAWFYQQNNSNDGLYSIFTGSDNRLLRGTIDKWNGSRYLPYWHKECNLINGTTFGVWPNRMPRYSSLNFFASDTCRILSYDYHSEEMIKGIKGYKYVPTRKMFASPKVNPANYCFNSSVNSPSGVFGVGPCRFGAPIFLSLPHFYLGEKRLINAVSGMQPHADKHSSEIIIEPDTGTLLVIDIKFQINLLLRNNRHIHLISDVTETYFPMFWMNEYIEISDDLAQSMKLVTVTLKNGINVFPLIMVFMGTILIFTAIFVGSALHFKIRLCLARKKKFSKYERLSTADKEEYSD